jgi:hypothetical protein
VCEASLSWSIIPHVLVKRKEGGRKKEEGEVERVIKLF